VAIKLLGHVWKNGATASEPGRRGQERVVEARERSRWNPSALGDATAATQPADFPVSEPVWAETEPWWHD